MRKVTLSIVSILALSGFAFAGGNIASVEEPKVIEVPMVDESAFYLGLGYSYILGNDKEIFRNVEIDDDDYTASSVMFQAGYKFNKYFALEGRYTLSAGDIAVSHNFNPKPDEKVDMDISNIGVYLKPMYPIGDFTVYGLLGYGKVKMEGNGWSWDDSGFQWGIGADYAINDNLSVFTDYTVWYNDDMAFAQRTGITAERTIDAFTVGLTYKF